MYETGIVHGTCNLLGTFSWRECICALQAFMTYLKLKVLGNLFTSLLSL